MRKMFPLTRTFVLVYHSTLVLTVKMVSSSITSVNPKYVTKQTLTSIQVKAITFDVTT